MEVINKFILRRVRIISVTNPLHLHPKLFAAFFCLPVFVIRFALRVGVHEGSFEQIGNDRFKLL